MLDWRWSLWTRVRWKDLTFKSVQSNRRSACDELSPNSSTGILERAVTATEPETRPFLAAPPAVPMGLPTLPLSIASCPVITSTQGGEKRGKELPFPLQDFGHLFYSLTKSWAHADSPAKAGSADNLGGNKWWEMRSQLFTLLPNWSCRGTDSIRSLALVEECGMATHLLWLLSLARLASAIAPLH